MYSFMTLLVKKLICPIGFRATRIFLGFEMSVPTVNLPLHDWKSSGWKRSWNKSWNYPQDYLQVQGLFLVLGIGCHSETRSQRKNRIWEKSEVVWIWTFVILRVFDRRPSLASCLLVDPLQQFRLIQDRYQSLEQKGVIVGRGLRWVKKTCSLCFTCRCLLSVYLAVHTSIHPSIDSLVYLSVKHF